MVNENGVLTLEDIMNDKMDERAHEKPVNPGTTQYRIRKGEYVAHMTKTEIRVDASDRKSLNIMARLYNQEEKFRGNVFFNISWEFRDRGKGGLDLKSRLFQGMVHSLGAPHDIELPDFLVGIKDEFVKVKVSEYFSVDYQRLLDEDKKGADPQSKYGQMVFINPEDDDKAQHYLDLGYQSKGMVLEVHPFTEEDDDIPF